MIPTVVLVGADKGGVGKTTVSRVFIDYLRSKSIDFRAFDTEAPLGTLKRFVSDKTTVVDLTKSDDQMKVFDTLGNPAVTVIDIRAGLLSPTLQTLTDIGFMARAKQGKLKIVVLHVLGPASTSLEEVAPIIRALDGARHIPIANHINETSYPVPDGSVNIPKLDDNACKAVDRAGVLFHEFASNSDSLVLTGYVNKWVRDVHAAFDAAAIDLNN
jgi:glutaredoxin-related protein